MNAAAPAPPADSFWGAAGERHEVWPAPAQELLLQATLLPDERALEAWRRVRPALDVAEMDGPTLALLPTLRRNLLALEVDDELLDLFKGVHRYGWARTQMLLAPMVAAVQALEDAGIPTLLLKGAALVSDRRLDAGTRPMNDVDVLVPTGRTAAAIDVLLGHGLEPVGGVPAWYVSEYAPAFVPSHGFRDELDRQLDLHWHVLHASCQADADDDFWAAAEQIELLGVATRALCPADELLLVILHGLRWNAIPTYRWVLDAALVCSGAFGEVDWERLVAQARKRRVAVMLHAGLSYLRRVVDAPVPERTLRSLRSPRPRVLERIEYRAQVTAPWRRSSLQWRVLYHEQRVRREPSVEGRLTPRRHLGIELSRLGIERTRELRRLFTGSIPGPGRPSCEVAAPVGAGLQETHGQPVAFGATLDFGDGGLARSYAAYGAWRAEGSGFWTAGSEACLQLPLAEPAEEALILDLSLDAFLAPGCSRQRLEVLANGRHVAQFEIGEAAGLREEESIVLPRDAVAGGERLQLLLRTPDATSSAALGIGDDDRELGVFVRTARVRKPVPCDPGTRLMLGKGSGDTGFVMEGWDEPEQRGRWTVARRARVLVRLSRVPRALDLELEAAPFLGPVERRLAVGVLVNGRAAGTLTYEGVDENPLRPSMTRMSVPEGAVGEDGEVLLEWLVGDPLSPHALGLSGDRRELGIFLVRLAFFERG